MDNLSFTRNDVVAQFPFFFEFVEYQIINHESNVSKKETDFKITDFQKKIQELGIQHADLLAYRDLYKARHARSNIVRKKLLMDIIKQGPKALVSAQIKSNKSLIERGEKDIEFIENLIKESEKDSNKEPKNKELFKNKKSNILLCLSNAGFFSKGDNPLEEEVNASYQNLVDEENKGQSKITDTQSELPKTKTTAAKKKKKKKNKSIMEDKPVTIHTQAASTPFAGEIEIDKQGLRAQKALEFYRQKSSYYIHPRVDQRWAEKDLDQLRQKTNPDYMHLTAEGLDLERAKHFWPHLEQLVSRKQDFETYTFPTDRGFGMLVEMEYKGRATKGIIYHGIGEDGVMFHRYFTSKAVLPNALQEIFFDQEPLPAKTSSEADNDWTSTVSYQFEFLDKGVVLFSYPQEERSLRIFPTQINFLDPKII